MFTGIISHLGTALKKTEKDFTFQAPKDLIWQIKKGSSIAVNGICLTVSKKNKNNFSVNVMLETFKLTQLSSLSFGDKVNLELPMRVNDRFEGHIVQGHIDGVGKIKNIKKQGNSHIFTIKVPPKLSKYIAEKGSIAVNGISLTVISPQNNFFKVGIIPYTFEHTMFQYAKVGDLVNIEVDILAKYLFRFYEIH